MGRKTGFTLLELMIVVSVLAVLLAIALPMLMRARMSANEASALSAVRTISSAQMAFAGSSVYDDNGDGMSDYGTMAQLSDPNGPGASPFIDEILGGGVKSGYGFAIDVTLGSGAVAPDYDCTAVPLRPGWSGQKSYYVDSSCVIRFNADGSVPDIGSTPI